MAIFRNSREASKHRAEERKDPGAKYKIHEMWARSKHQTVPGTCQGQNWSGLEFNYKVEKVEQSAHMRSRFANSGGHEWMVVGTEQKVIRKHPSTLWSKALQLMSTS